MDWKRTGAGRALRASLALALALGMAPSFAFADESASEVAEPNIEPQATAKPEADLEATEAEPETSAEAEPLTETEAIEETTDSEAALEEEAEATEQKCGDNLEWSVDEYGTLTIAGEGAMWDFSDESPAPWADQADRITSLVIEEGATSIGANAFNCLYALESVQLPESVGEVPDGAFDGTPYQAAIDEAAAAEAEQQAAEQADAAVEAVEQEQFEEAEAATEAEAEKAELETEEAAELEAAEVEPAAEEKAEPAAITSGKDSAKTDDDDLELIAQTATSGKCGPNATWSFSNGTLTISGTGAMYDYSNPKDAPWWENWYTYLEIDGGAAGGIDNWDDYLWFESNKEHNIYYNTRKIVVSPGITSIGNNAFYKCRATSVSIPNTVTRIGNYAFQYSQSLHELIIPDSVTTIGEGAFYDSTELTYVTFGRGSALSSVGEEAFVGYDAVLGYNNIHARAYKGTQAYDALVAAGVEVESLGSASVSDATVSLSYSSTTYTGAAKKPSVTVKLGSKTLKAGTDYTVAYSNNIKPGTATVKVTGKGKYSGSVSKTFTIKPSVANATVKLSYTKANYNSKARKPIVTVTHNSKKLVAGTDYTVAYSNNVKPGTATVKVTGKGKYGGTKSATFKILAPGWRQASGYWYYYDDYGKKITGIKKIDGKIYVFDSYGRMAKGGWKSYSGSWYYLRSDGSAYASRWLQEGSKWYRFGSSGKMLTGRYKIGSSHYLFSSSGAMKTGWVKSSDKWRYYLSSGAEAHGWQSIGGKWYWFDSKGFMATGKRTISGKVYRFASSGAWIG